LPEPGIMTGAEPLRMPAKGKRKSFQGCQILLVQHTKTGKRYTNNHKMYQMTTKYTK
jgi:hypothetical protein